jgi:Protein of unknown function (DUF1360)
MGSDPGVADDPPTQPHDYAVFNVAWAALLGAVVATTRAKGPPPRELPLFGLASFSLAKTLSKEKVGTWVRRPVVDETVPERRPKGSGLRYAAGELMTCTRCLGTWSALGLVGLRAARPREARLVAGVLATSAINDFLQCGFSWLTSSANRSATAPPRPSP